MTRPSTNVQSKLILQGFMAALPLVGASGGWPLEFLYYLGAIFVSWFVVIFMRSIHLLLPKYLLCGFSVLLIMTFAFFTHVWLSFPLYWSASVFLLTPVWHDPKLYTMRYYKIWIKKQLVVSVVFLILGAYMMACRLFMAGLTRWGESLPLSATVVYLMLTAIAIFWFHRPRVSDLPTGQKERS